VLHLELEMLQEETKPTTAGDDANAAAKPTPSPKGTTKSRKINHWKQEINCEGKTFTYRLPTTHEIPDTSNVLASENDRDTLKQIRDKMQKTRCETDSVMSQSL